MAEGKPVAGGPTPLPETLDHRAPIRLAASLSPTSHTLGIPHREFLRIQERLDAMYMDKLWHFQGSCRVVSSGHDFDGVPSTPLSACWGVFSRSMKGDVKRKVFPVGLGHRVSSASSPTDGMATSAAGVFRNGDVGLLLRCSVHARAGTTSTVAETRPASRLCANHGSIGDSWPTAFWGCARGPKVPMETGRRSAGTERLTTE